MTKEKSREKRFGKYIGCHLRCWKPYSGKGAVIEKLANEVMTNVDVFGSRRNNICIGYCACALVVAKDRECSRGW